MVGIEGEEEARVRGDVKGPSSDWNDQCDRRKAGCFSPKCSHVKHTYTKMSQKIDYTLRKKM